MKLKTKIFQKYIFMIKIVFFFLNNAYKYYLSHIEFWEKYVVILILYIS